MLCAQAACLDIIPGPDVVIQMSSALKILRHQKNRMCEARALHAMGAILFRRGETSEAKVVICSFRAQTWYFLCLKWPTFLK